MIGFLKQLVVGTRPKHGRGEVLAARPVRHPGVEWERGRVEKEQPPTVLLRVPRRSDRWGELVARVFRLPSHRKIELDEMGSDVWEMCDGTLTVDALTRAVCAKYHLNRRQGEASVTAYMKMLAERRLLALKINRRAGNANKGAEESGKSARRRRRSNERTGRAPARR